MREVNYVFERTAKARGFYSDELVERLRELRDAGDEDAPGLRVEAGRQHAGQPLGERMVLSGRVLGSDGKPLRGQLVEIWQANAAGRYAHEVDDHDAPLDPNFSGAGRCLTDPDGSYRFTTVKPGAYPWGNHHNAWRPNHIHFSVFGHSFLSRLVTQMYFPGDPLFPFDPIFNSVTDEKARQRMVSQFDLDNTIPDWALCFRFDIVLRGREATPQDTDKH